MTPSARPVRKTVKMGRQVQSRIHSQRAPASNDNVEERLQQFREARKARELERFAKLRECRLKSSSTTAGSVAASMSITSSASSVKAVVAKVKLPTSTKTSKNALMSRGKAKPVMSSTCRDQKGFRPQGEGSKAVLPPKVRKSLGGRKSILKRQVEKKVVQTLKNRKFPIAEVKLTKTAKLRMLKSDPLLELSYFIKSASNHSILPPPPPKHNFDPSGNESKQSLSRIPVPKTSFVSPVPRTISTPKPSPLRERLSEWLNKRDHSLDNFKHLKCFGVLGPAVKRPQTPFRKKLFSTSSLKSIPERTENIPNHHIEDSGEGDDVLNTTFTLEEEDKENILLSNLNEQAGPSYQNSVETSSAEQVENIKDLDQANGVLSELHKLIQMGYPMEQCELWLRAIRRRFPQCGDEAVYWECLASLEEFRGDLQTAVSCYERALLQGAADSVQNSLDELHKKMSDLKIEPIVNINNKKSANVVENNVLKSTNIIKSSTIQFAVQENKRSSAKKNESSNDLLDTVFTATPVRRSMRLAGTPSKVTPGIKCVRSLEFLEPEVRSSLVFHGNSALAPRD